jgi:hypothetical protein
MWHAFAKFVHAPIIPTLAVATDAGAALTNAWSPLINLGAIGCVLAWFLIRAEPRMGRIERAIDRANRANLIAAQLMSDIAEGRKVSEMTRQQAREIVKEIDDARTT